MLECKWASHPGQPVGTAETPGVITSLNYAQGQSAICIRGAFIWLMSGGGRHHPAWRCSTLCSLRTAPRMKRVMQTKAWRERVRRCYLTFLLNDICALETYVCPPSPKTFISFPRQWNLPHCVVLRVWRTNDSKLTDQIRDLVKIKQFNTLNERFDSHFHS